ncbi:MAG TPA: CoA-binding protein [Terriglobia bacterium]|nr:CoA-binding protein [Terriglobia bacterium]
MNLKETLRSAGTVLVIDWPTRDIPESLALAGFRVVVWGGPGPEDYSAYELKDGTVITSRIGHPPRSADLIYAYRPFSELPEIIATAKRLGASTIWTQSGLSPDGRRDTRGCWVQEDELRAARELVQSAGLNHVSEPYLGDVARKLKASSL